jgi:hypothetical protein
MNPLDAWWLAGDLITRAQREAWRQHEHDVERARTRQASVLPLARRARQRQIVDQLRDGTNTEGD